MKLNWEPITLDLKTTWRIAHGASDQRYNVVIQLEEGLGEAAGVPHHGESQEGIIAYLEAVAGEVSELEDPGLMEDILNALPPGSQAARAGIDLALHDLWGKRLNQPLYRLLGLDPKGAPQTCYTIGIDTPEEMARKAVESGWPILKIKLGSPGDFDRVVAIRQASPARLRVDANAGWNREQALELIPRLTELGVELVEQPLPVDDLEGLRMLRKKKFGVPILADEPVKTSRDVARHAGAVDGVVIKLQKTGGIREALRAIHTARALDMLIMIGCMVETSLGVTAAAHLAPLCDYVDLDGPLLIRNDPFAGLGYNGPHLELPTGPGLGVTRRENSS